jgi:hypothetical protein
MIRKSRAALDIAPRLSASIVCLFCSVAFAQAQERNSFGDKNPQFFPSPDQATEMQRKWEQIIELGSAADAATREAVAIIKRTQNPDLLQPPRMRGDFWKPGELNRMQGR